MDFLDFYMNGPIIGDLYYYGYWLVVFCILPFVGIFTVFFDLFSGHLLTWVHEPVSKDKVVLVTGCDTGFGRELAIRLAGRGFTVYAGCLGEQGIKSLNSEHPDVIAIKLDVTKIAEVKAAAARVAKEHPQGLHAVVNNAGIIEPCYIDWVTTDSFRKHMDVNFFGTVQTTLEFLPQIKKCKGRVINVASLCTLTCGHPIIGLYGTSKAAVEAFTGSLRQEMKVWGVKVIGINPGHHRTDMMDTSIAKLRSLWEKAPENIRAAYGEDFPDAIVDVTYDRKFSVAGKASAVVNAMERAVTARYPRIQYPVGFEAQFIIPYTRVLPLRLQEYFSYFFTTNARMRKPIGGSDAGEAKVVAGTSKLAAKQQ